MVGILTIPLLLYACSPDKNQKDPSKPPVSEAEANNRNPPKVTEPLIPSLLNDSTQGANRGEAVYKAKCMICHQKNGEGRKGVFPPLAGSDYLFADNKRAIREIIHGLSGEITVNGTVYDGVMLPQGLSDTEVLDVVNYILNAWGNEGGTVTIDDVKAQR